MIVAVFVFLLGVYIFHRINSERECEALKSAGYYNPVSVGDHSLNVAKFGNESGAHTIVCMAGLGSGEFPVTARHMTTYLEKDNSVVFVDRAGYGLSDDTDGEMMLESIVEDYRRALKNAGIDAPYILMPHSIGGAYANFWVSHYPEEIEAVVFVDGSELSATAFEEEPAASVSPFDRFLAFAAKMGFGRLVLGDYFYLLSDGYSEEEQVLADALMLMTLDSVAPVAEAGRLAENAQNAFNGIVTNDVPKLYICASWGFQNADEIIEYHRYMNKQIEKNALNVPKGIEEYAEDMDDVLAAYEEARADIIEPYAAKMGNCEVVCLGGDHMIYEQKPYECAMIITEFIGGLE
ncbi:MAG: alpha/beta hydrolase [Eubacterium sp.]|nr:alpha/beta hydrolase [Eubacterium sp.]MCM1417705.1 alpha/beta hydrolase [Roseburia sp.]